MTIRLTGILPNPFGEPCPKALIRFTAIATEGGMLKGVDAVATTDKNGSYDFTLEQGRYLLEIQYSDEYQESGSVLIDEASPDTMTLQELIRYTTPYTPPLVDDTPADWLSLFEGVLTNPDWQHEHENQVRNEDVLVNTDKVISSKDSAQLAQETHTTTTGSVKSVNQTLAYEGSGKEAAYNKSDLEAGNLSASSGSELYSESTGSEARQHSTLQSDTTTSEHVQQITDTNATSQQKDSVGSHTALHRQEVSDSQVSITESVSDGSMVVTEKKVIDANALVTALIEQGVTIENVEAFDRLIVDADGSSRQIQVDEFKVGNTFEVDTQNDVVQVRGQLKISNGDDYRGPVGNSQYYEYAYATQEGKDTNDWYIDDPDDPYDLPQGTVWRKHRMVTIIDGETTRGNWSEPYLLTGKDGAEGDTLYWVYMYSADNVLTDPSAEVPAGWSSDLKDGHLYRIERLKNKGVYEGVWSTPAKIAGADGDNGELVFEEYMYSPYGTSTPDNDTQGHWHTNFTSGDFYRSSRLIKYAAGTPIPLPADAEPIEVTAWTTPALITPRKGFEYSDGLSQIVVHMYIRSQSAPALPTATLTYDFNTFTLSGDKAGWATEIPEGTGNLWLTIATASSNTGSDDIAPNEWTAPQLSATQAYNQASLSLYKRSPVGVVPDAPSTTLTYDFTTGVLTGDLEGWSNGTIPAGTEDLYIASAAVRSQTNTANIEPEYWGVGILTSTAFRQQTVNIYKRGNATRPSADVTYNFTDGSVTGLSEGWTLDIPSGSEDVFIGVAVASAAGVTDIINPADWSIGPLGTSGHQAVVLNLYMSSQTKPQEPQVEITYDFTQGKIVSDTGLWSTSVPQNTEGKIYVTTATANASALAQTDVIPVGEWTDPQVILESGVNAVPVTLYRKHALDSVPSKHTNDLTYSFDNAGLVNQPNNNWKATPMSVELGEAVWSMTATAQGLASDPTDVIEPTEFSDPVIYTATGSEVFTVYQYAESETGPWFDDFTPARVWRIQGTSVNGVVNDWSDPVKMTGEDGAVGDTIYFEYNYSEDLSNWHPVLVEGDIWRRERIVNNGVAGEWSSPARLKGNEQYIEYQYSASLELGEAGWHSNFSTGDYYRRERSITNGVAGSWTNGVQIVPLKDVDYSDGTGGDTIYEVYQYSVDGLTDWEYDFEDHHIYRRTAVVINGALGAWSEPAKLSGIDGAPGDTIYMEYEYSADGLTWHKDMQDGDIWRHEREHTVGVTDPTDPWGNRTRIRGVDGAYYEYLYNEDDDNYPTTPEDDLGTWHSNFSEGDYYRIERLVQESSVGNWTTPTKLKPKKGEDYNDGIQGPKGEDGSTTYTWLKYADDDSGSNMTDSPVGKAYMGLAYNKLTDEESTNPNDYAWSKVEGDQGVAGENGYMWVQYSNHDDGMNGSVPAMSQNPIDETTGRPYMYIGISYNNPDPTEGGDPTEYTWSKYIGDEIYYEYSYSPDKITWDMTLDENDIWRRERRVENGQYGEWSDAIRIVGTEGPQGIKGDTGEDGQSLYTWVRYADDQFGNGISNNPTGKKYIGFAYNKATPIESNIKDDYSWSLVQGADGKDGLNGADGVDGLDGAQGIAGKDGKDGISSYFHTAYADGPNGEGFSQSPVGKDYIGTYADQYIEDSTNPAVYTWVLVKGAQGEDGSQGIPGVDGESGKTSYLHIAYAETAQGGYMSQDPEGKSYIGQYVDFILEDSTDPSDYTWAKIKGEDGLAGADGIDGLDGKDGINGQDGADGKSTYFHIAYADDEQGNGFSQSPVGKAYMGTYADYEPVDSSNPNDYVWIKTEGAQGADGATGIPGKNGANGETSYLHIAYADTSTGSGFSQSPDGKDYIGQYVDFEAQDSNNPADYTWSLIKGEKGDQGVEGPIGPDGKPTYTWIKYSPNADGSNLTDTPQDDTKYLGISPNQTDINESSDPADYTWSAYTGSDGQYYEDEFSITGDPQDEEAWHYPAFHQDKFKRTRLIDSEGEPVVDPTTDENGWVYTQIVPIKDVDYGDGSSGDTIFEVYEYSVDGVTEWHVDFTDEDLYRRTATVINGSLGPWSEAGKLSGVDGADGDTIWIKHQYSVDAQNWHDTFTNGDVWRRDAVVTNDVVGDWTDPARIRGEDGLDGTDGIAGKDGADGQTTYFHTAYADDSSGSGFSQSPTGKTHIGTYVDFTQEDSNDPADYNWVLFVGADGSDGLDGTDGIPGENGIDGKTSYLHMAYADDANGNGFSQSPVDKAYLGQYVDFIQQDSDDPNDYTWALIKGADGRDGIDGANGQDGLDGKDGIQGPKGEDGQDGTNGTDGQDGQTSYFHIAYADDAQGNGFSQSPANKEYIGTYSDFDPVDSDNPSDYTWMLAKGADGEDGAQGIPGQNGTNGQTSYLHIAYADDEQGNGLSQSPAGKLYIGQYVDFILDDSNDPADYVWALIKGSDGSDGQDGKDGSYWEYEYSINGVDDWHTNFLTGDHFQRARLITPPSTVGDWQVTQVVPIKDVDFDDGNSGDTIYEVYQYSVNGVDNWEDDFKDEHVFRRTAVVVNGSQSDWSAAARIMGNDGQNGLQSNVITLYQVKQQKYTWLPQELIQTEETYNIISGSFVGYDTESGINGWMIDVPAVLNEGEALYQVRVAALSEAGQLEVDIPADDWAAPVQITASGVSGSDGKHGSGSYIINWEDTYNGGNGYASLILTLTPPLSEGYVEYWFQEISGRESQAGDMLTIQQPEVNSAIPAQWLRSDSAWEKFTLTVDGSAVVNGTLAAEALKSETSITDILYVASNASRAELTLSGSGGWTDGAGIVVTSSNYRQWLGHVDPAQAPYSVTKEGKLKAQGANIGGDITAESLTFVSDDAIPDSIDNSNNTAESVGADPKGSASTAEQNAINKANQERQNWSDSNVYPDQDSTQIKSSNYQAGIQGWAIDKNGNVEFHNGLFRGTLYASDLVGDIYTRQTWDIKVKQFGAIFNSGSATFSETWCEFNVAGVFGLSRSLEIDPFEVSQGHYLLVLEDGVEIFREYLPTWTDADDMTQLISLPMKTVDNEASVNYKIAIENQGSKLQPGYTSRTIIPIQKVNMAWFKSKTIETTTSPH